MKKLFFLIAMIAIVSCKTENKHNGHPMIKATATTTNFKVAENWYNGWWSVAPQVAHDTLKISCFSKQEPFVFKTDIDSISFTISPGKSYDFYVHLNDSVYAHTIITGVPFQKDHVTYQKSPKNDAIAIRYEQDQKNSYLSQLATKYPIQQVIAQSTNDTDKLLQVLDWTNSRWKHSGNNSPSKSDPITILDEAKAGGRFPCFAYAIVLKAQLENAGFKARTIYLKTKDVETRKSSPGHVATEVYSDELQKWVFLDGQFNIMPVLNNVPLNAVEFQKALTENYDALEFRSLKEVSKRMYTEFVYDYLYYFDTSLDHRNRTGTDIKKHRIEDKSSLMLVPVGAKNPTKIDFWNMEVDYCIYTNSLADFYAKP